MDAKNRQFLDLINGSKQFVVPVFQRDYSWTQDQCLRFWKDVLHAGRLNSAGGHFLGSIVYVGVGPTRAAFNTLQVIDGQQRLTTLILLLTALRDHIADLDWTGTDDSPTPHEIDQVFLKNPKKGDRAHKLRLRRADNDNLRSLIDAEGATDTTNSNLIGDAYNYFRSQLKNSDPDVVYSGLGRLIVVDVALDRAIDNPQLIFESLNSTGVALSQSDLIRNYLLMGLDEDQQTFLYDRYWIKIEADFRRIGSTPDRFLREYVALKSKSRKAVRDPDIYDEFKRYWDPTATTSLVDLLADITKFADYYARIVSPRKSSSHQPPALVGQLSHLKASGIVHAMLAMQLYDYYRNGLQCEADFLASLNLIESYVVRRSVLGWSSHDYWSVFAAVVRYLRENAEAEGPLDSLKVAFASQRRGFPTDDEFKKALQEVDLYGRRNCFQILTRLENYNEREPTPTEALSVEHIMPQAVAEVRDWREMLGDKWEETHGAWLHRLGNLTLTGYNSSMSNKPFAEKKSTEGGFNDSAARLNKDVRQEDRWTSEQMEARGARLAERSLRVWPHHGANEKLLREAKARELRRRAKEKDLRSLDMKPHVRQLAELVLEGIRAVGAVVEVIEKRSICCYTPPDFFVEVLPMTGHVRLILPLEFEELNAVGDLTIRDTSAWSWVQNRVHTECNVLVEVRDQAQATAAMALVRQALAATDFA